MLCKGSKGINKWIRWKSFECTKMLITKEKHLDRGMMLDTRAMLIITRAY